MTSSSTLPTVNADQAATQVLLPALTPGTAFGAYRIIGQLGVGGMGEVYQAVQGTLERVVALKVMRPELAADPQFSERFLREARAAASVCHHHVVVIFDAGTCDGRLFMAFQFVSGGDLDAQLARRERLPVGEALQLIARCCDGLQAIHEAGLVHRDIKPHNIFLDAQGRPKLGDFGLARQAQGNDRMTVTGIGMGTPSYMAPEQAQGLADIDIRADIHALGGTLYTLLTGVPPFTGLTPWMVVNAVCNEPAPDPRLVLPDLPEAVAAIVMRCLAKRRDQRYATPSELHADLVRVLAAINGPLTPAQSAQLPQLPLPLGFTAVRRMWLPLTLTTAALAALPWVLRPLLQINEHVHASTWNEASWWAGFISLLLSAAMLLMSHASIRRDQLALSIPLLASTVATWLAGWFMTRALLATGDGIYSGWDTLATLGNLAATCGFLGWHLPRWWGHDAQLAGRAYPRALAALSVALLVALICHLAIAERPLRTTVGEESRSAWGDIRHAFTGQDTETTGSSRPRAMAGLGAAHAVAWLAPLTVLFIAPTLLAWRERRRLSYNQNGLA